MNWFNGDVSEAVQKAIGESKIFIVFVRGKGVEYIFSSLIEITHVCNKRYK